jgi:transposase
MLTFPPSVRVFACTQAVDMRKGFDGLMALAQDVMKQDPLSGHLFVFRSKGGDRLKVLYWGGDGLCLWYKRLERGTFELAQGPGGALEISPSELSMLIDGIDLHARRRRRFKPAMPKAA